MTGTSTTDDVTVTEDTVHDSSLQSIEIMDSTASDELDWCLVCDTADTGPHDPLLNYVKDTLSLPDADDVENGRVYGETRHEEKTLPEWKADPHTDSPSDTMFVSTASIKQIEAEWRSDTNEWIVDIPDDEEDIIVKC